MRASESCSYPSSLVPRRRLFSILERLQVLGPLIKGARALHDAGYAHRNIKPSNILRRSSQRDWALSDLASCKPLGVPLHPLSA